MTYDIVIGRSKKDRKEFGLDGTIFLGKHYVQMGQTVALSNKIYLDMIRSHVVFACGKRGSGKCVHGDTLVTLENGKRIRIRDVAENSEKVATINSNLKVAVQAQEQFCKRSTSKLLHVRMRSGKEIKLTPEHPLLTIKGWKEAGSLARGERIATPRTLPLFGNRSVPQEQVKILAYLIAEGSITQNAAVFCNTDKTLIADFIAAVSAYSDQLRVAGSNNTYRVARRDGKSVRGGNDALNLLRELNLQGKHSYHKFVPGNIFTATKENVALFLNRMFSCDGSIHYNTSQRAWRISYASSSKLLIGDVSSLLLKFGILSRIRPKLIRGNGKKFASYELEVRSQHIPLFIEEIGFCGRKEQLAASAYLETKNMKRNPNVDTVPKEIWDEYRPENWAAVGRALGYAHPKAMRERIRYAPGRQMLAQIAEADEREDIKRIAEADIFWDEIASVKELTGRFTVYDIAVPGTHNFIANDIVVHNSYTMGVIAEGMADLPEHIRKNLSIIMLDTMGIYWTMKYPNQKEKELLDKWDLEPKSLDVTIFTPKGFYAKAKEEGIPTDRAFAIKPSELLGSDWVSTFGIQPNSAASVLIERVVHELRETKGEFTIEDILTGIQASDHDATAKAVASNRFLQAQTWGLFDDEGTPLSELAAPGQVTILDLSAYATQEHGWEIKALVTGLVSQKLFLERMQARKDEEFRQVYRDVNYLAAEDDLQQKLPLVWLVIDEAHEFLPNQGSTLATDPLVTILREGRQPGISLILASQQPGKIHTDVMTQADTVISHRITAKLDTDALGLLMQSYMRQGLDNVLDGLPRTSGAAIILDDSNEKMFPIQIRPRFTWHGGESPTALKKEKELFEF